MARVQRKHCRLGAPVRRTTLVGLVIGGLVVRGSAQVPSRVFGRRLVSHLAVFDFPRSGDGAYQPTRSSTTFWSGKSWSGSCIGLLRLGFAWRDLWSVCREASTECSGLRSPSNLSGSFKRKFNTLIYDTNPTWTAFDSCILCADRISYWIFTGFSTQ